MLSPQWLDELRARTTLSTLVGRSVRLVRAGAEWRAPCPFHDEKTPSFYVNDAKGFYHCFGCSAHGDAIRWMTEHGGLSFIDAVKELAAAAGLEMPAPDPRQAARAEAQATLRDVTEAAAGVFRDQLAAAEGADARAYCDARGVTPALREAFGIGFAPDARGRLAGALSRFPTAMLVEAGLLIDPATIEGASGREPYDRFRGRLMIPIRDPRGRVIAFGGRILGAGEPKYLNSPDTPLFDKGRILYNLDRAAPASRKSRRLVVVEGYLDVIALAGAGIEEAVAPLGTALTEAQLTLAWKLAPVPILCLDGDAAGQRAAMRAAMRALPLLRPGHSLAFARLPAGRDPDDVVRDGGARAFEAVLADAVPLVDFLWAATLAEAPVATPEERAALRQRLEAHVATIADRDIAFHYRAAFRERMDQLFERPRRDRPAPPAARGPARAGGATRGGRVPPPPADPLPATRTGAAADPAARLIPAILAGCLRHPAALASEEEALARLPIADPALDALRHAMLDSAHAAAAPEGAEEMLDTGRLLTILGRTDVYDSALALLRADGMPFSFTQRLVATTGSEDADRVALRDLGEAIRLAGAWPRIDRDVAAATARFGETLAEEDFASQQRLLAVRAAMVYRLVRLGDPGDGG